VRGTTRHLWRKTLILIVVVFSGEARAESINTLGAGVSKSCGSWLSARSSGDYFTVGNWALGFLSGVAMYGHNLDPLEGVDSNAVAYWLDNYCQARPTDVVDALKAFIRQHPR
jgi:hypothetical protein